MHLVNWRVDWFQSPVFVPTSIDESARTNELQRRNEELERRNEAMRKEMVEMRRKMERMEYEKMEGERRYRRILIMVCDLWSLKFFIVDNFRWVVCNDLSLFIYYHSLSSNHLIWSLTSYSFSKVVRSISFNSLMCNYSIRYLSTWIRSRCGKMSLVQLFRC